MTVIVPGIIAYAPEFFSILTHKEITDDEDDQLFYTQAYLNESMRNSLKIKLDHKSQIFHNLNGAVGKHCALLDFINALKLIRLLFYSDEIALKMKNHEAYVENTAMKTTPVILHANGPTNTKLELNNLGNYLARSWSSGEGCIACKENTISLSDKEVTFTVKSYEFAIEDN